MRVPDRLRERVGRLEVRKSLRTYSPALARELAATVSAKLREAFMTIDENTNVTPDEARELMRACFAETRREVDLQPPFVPETNYPEMEIEEQASHAEAEITRLAGELEHRAFSIGTTRAAEKALSLRGTDMKLIAPEARLRLLDGFTRLLIEKQRLELVRLRDPLADFQPLDPLFNKPVSGQKTNSQNIEEFGPSVGPAPQVRGRSVMPVQLNQPGQLPSFPLTSPLEEVTKHLGDDWIASLADYGNRQIVVTVPFPDTIRLTGDLLNEDFIVPDHSGKSVFAVYQEIDLGLLQFVASFPADPSNGIEAKKQTKYELNVLLKDGEEHLGWAALKRRKGKDFGIWSFTLQFSPFKVGSESLPILIDRLQDAFCMIDVV
jgi:hypothetical protein